MAFDIKQLLDLLKLGVSKLNAILLWIAGFLANWMKVDVNNIHLILIIALSLWASRRLMLFIYSSGEEGRTEIWLIIAAVIFGVLYFLK